MAHLHDVLLQSFDLQVLTRAAIKDLDNLRAKQNRNSAAAPNPLLPPPSPLTGTLIQEHLMSWDMNILNATATDIMGMIIKIKNTTNLLEKQSMLK